jgi:hypothetical protein
MMPINADQRLTLFRIVEHATPAVQLIILALAAGILVAIAVCLVKLSAGPRLSGGSAYLSGLRLGGPLAGLLGAAYGALNMTIGLSNVVGPVPLNVLAHGFAEVMLMIVLGLLAGAVAVIANWAVESRIDRSVLRA